MRLALIMLIALLSAASIARAEGPKSPRGILFAHECQQVNDRHLGFTCDFDRENGRLTLIMHEKFSEMESQRSEQAEYESLKIGLRWLELGGGSYIRRADYWQADQGLLCFGKKGSPSAHYCSAIKLNN